MAIGLYNYVRFQDIFETGYEKGFNNSFFTGLSGILFSPGKSIFLYNPLTLLGCLALPVFNNDRKLVLFGWIIASHLILFSFWHSWYGGMGWGPRLMLVTLPYLILPVGFLLETRPTIWKRPVIGMIALGILIQIPSVTVNVARYYYDLRSQFAEKSEEMLVHSPMHTPILGQWKEVGIVLQNQRDGERMRRLAADAKAGRRFIGKSDREVLDHGLAVNAPNFWWYYMILFGYPLLLAISLPLALFGVALFFGYRIYVAGQVEPRLR
jgi:hypothetical protein